MFVCIGVQRDGAGSGMFYLATSFNQPLNLNTSRVTNMQYVVSFAVV